MSENRAAELSGVQMGYSRQSSHEDRAICFNQFVGVSCHIQFKEGTLATVWVEVTGLGLQPMQHRLHGVADVGKNRLQRHDDPLGRASADAPRAASQRTEEAWTPAW